MRATSTSGKSTISIIAVVTVAAFALAMLAGWGNMLSYAAGFVPLRVEQPNLLDNAGLPIPVVPMLLTPLSATLLHGGWMHLGFNILILLFCGRQVEAVLGSRLILLLYGVGAYTAAAGQWLMDPQMAIPMIGASGAISAVIAAYALLFGGREVKALGPIPAGVVRMLWLGAGWVFLQFLIDLATRQDASSLGAPGGAMIAIGAHIGGFIGGLLIVKPLLKMRFKRRQGPF